MKYLKILNQLLIFLSLTRHNRFRPHASLNLNPFKIIHIQMKTNMPLICLIRIGKLYLIISPVLPPNIKRFRR